MSLPAQFQVTQSPSSDLVAITPNDDNPISSGKFTRGIYIGSISGGATMTVLTRTGQSVQFTGLVAGSILPIQVSGVKSTGTTASGLIALF